VGQHLIYTHLHDNRGQYDDHFIPGDGSLDMELLVAELRESGYAGGLTLEVDYTTYRDRMSPEAFVKRCYQVACKLAEQL
jgi:sugar phosphate isomerase/epimerase